MSTLQHGLGGGRARARKRLGSWLACFAQPAAIGVSLLSLQIAGCADGASSASTAGPGHAGHTTTAPDAAVKADASVDGSVPRCCDLSLSLDDMDSALGHQLQCLLLSSDGELHALAEIDKLSSAADTLSLSNVVSSTDMVLECWVDDNDSRALEAPPTDRGFRLPLPAQPPYALTLTGSMPAADITSTQPRRDSDFVGHFTGFEPHEGLSVMLTLRVAGSDREVALLRIPRLSGSANLDLMLPGVITPGVDYTAFWYIDLNRNGKYDLHGDHSGTITTSVNEHGFVIHHDHRENRTWQA